jgi:hypothetical protein
LLKIKLFRAIAIGNTDEKDIAPKPLLARSLAPTGGAGSLVNSGQGGSNFYESFHTPIDGKTRFLMSYRVDRIDH